MFLGIAVAPGGTMRPPDAAAPDTTPPVLTLASATATGQTTFDWSVTTDETGGTLFWIASSSATVPSAAQIKAGQDHTGGAAAVSGSQAVAATGSQNGSGTGLTADTAYTWFALQSDAAGNDSGVVSDGFTTDAQAGPSANIFPFGAEDIGDTAIWAPNNKTITGPSADGGYTLQDTGPGDRLRYDTSALVGETLVDGQAYTFALKARQGTADDIAVQFLFGPSAGERVTFDLATGSWAAATNLSLDFDAQDGDGFYRLFMSWTQSGSRFLIDIASAYPTGRTHIIKEPMLYEGLVSVVGKLPYEGPDP